MAFTTRYPAGMRLQMLFSGPASPERYSLVGHGVQIVLFEVVLVKAYIPAGLQAKIDAEALAMQEN